MKKILAIDIDEVIRSKWLQFDRFYAQEFDEAGIKQPFDTYDLRNHYKFDETTDTINYLNLDLPEDISPTEYMLDKDGNAPVDFMAFRKRDETLTADQMFNKFLEIAEGQGLKESGLSFKQEPVTAGTIQQMIVPIGYLS